jgi:hypothetical protein
MEQGPSLPLEILFDIFGYLKPPTALVGDNAAWNGPKTLHNWWDKAISTTKGVLDGGTPLPGELVSPERNYAYTDLLVLRQ